MWVTRQGAGMRWEELFADLEAQVEALEAADLVAEISDRTRREQALLGLADRLRAAADTSLTVHAGSVAVCGRLLGSGRDWLLLEEPGRRQVLVALAAISSVAGLGGRTDVPGGDGEVARRLDLRWALRGLARNRLGVQVLLGDRSTLDGTLDRVGADHVDLALHAPGEVRRASAVREVRTVPLAAVVMVRSAG